MTTLSVRDQVPAESHPISLRDVVEGEDASTLREALVGRRDTGATPPTLLWQGFDHEWGYNHRANRLGSYVRPADGDDLDTWVVGHTAASGSGPDTADVTDYYATLAAEGLRATTTRVKLEFSGSDTTRTFDRATPSIDLPEPMRDREEYAVLLNGFDLISDGDADKLMLFELEIDEQPADVRDDSLEAEVEARITADCSTPECSDDVTTFTLFVDVLVLAGDADEVAFSEVGKARNAYSWETGNADEEIHLAEDGVTTFSADRPDSLAAEDSRATLGFTGFYLDLEKTGGHVATHAGEALHLLQLAVAVRSLSQEPDEISADVSLFFKNWAQGMKAEHFPESQLSLKDAGNADVAASMLSIEVAEPLEYAERHRSTSIQWDADGSSWSDAAEREETVVVDDE